LLYAAHYADDCLQDLGLEFHDMNTLADGILAGPELPWAMYSSTRRRAAANVFLLVEKAAAAQGIHGFFK